MLMQSLLALKIIIQTSLIHITIKGMIILIISVLIRPSIFLRIEWPRNRNILAPLNRRIAGSSWLKNGDVRSNEWGLKLQNSNHRDRGKDPMGQELEFWACQQCAASGLQKMVCSQRSICSRCQKMGHSSPHCKAQWHPTSRKLDLSSRNRVGTFQKHQVLHQQTPSLFPVWLWATSLSG
jgi:hypothetical protein